MRKLARIEEIANIQPIENADAIELTRKACTTFFQCCYTGRINRRRNTN